MARISHVFLVLSSIAGLSLVATAPLWLTPGLPNSDDSLTHIFNFFAFDRQIRSGEWFPLRLPDHGLAYGYAVPAYYPPLPYMFWELIHLAGAGHVLTFKLGFTLITILAGWTSFALGRALFGLRSGLVVAFVYVLSPYLLANLHFRGALAEHLGLAIGPLLLLAIYRLVQEPGWGTYLATTAAVALLIVTHFISTLLYLPFALLFALWLVFNAPPVLRTGALFWLAAAGLSGAVLTAFYWLPAALEPDGLKQINSAAALAAYLDEATPLSALLRPSLIIQYANRHAMPELGLPFWLLVGGAVAALTFVGRRGLHHDWRFWAVMGGGGIVLSSTVVTPLWRLIPAVALLQFPFRWLGPAALALALLVGAAVALIGERAGHRLRLGMGVLVAVLLLWYGVAGLWNLPTAPAMLRSLGVAQVGDAHINLAGLRAFAYDQADNLRRNCWVWAYEYVPRTSSLSDCESMRDMILLAPRVTTHLPPVRAEVQASQLTPNRLAANVSSPDPWTLSLHAFWIPGWRAMVDGRPVAPQSLEPLGVVSIPVPAGEHTVQIEQGPTQLRQSARWLSALLLLVWLVLALRWRPRIGIGVLVGLLLLIGPPVLVASQAAPPPPLQDMAVEFAGQMALQGYALAVTPGQVQLNLVWLARQEMEASYKVFVHIIDDTGRLWAQADSRPMDYASNTNRWLPGQLVLDVHWLQLPAEMPWGQYQVRVGLYDEVSGERLPVVDDTGVVMDDQVLLGYVAAGVR